MDRRDFYVDFNIEVPEIGDEFNREAEQQLRALVAQYSDLIGAAVSPETIVEVESRYL